MPELQDQEVELPAALGDGFDTPREIPPVLYAFPAQVEALMPTWDAIPDDFKRQNEWVRYVEAWFFHGFTGLFTREDIAGEDAYRHLDTILRSFQPKHEHKVAAVAWLASRWFASIPEKTTDQDDRTNE